MARVKVGPALPDTKTLDVRDLRARWRNAFRPAPPRHLPRHLLFRVLAYRLQADRLGDLDSEGQRLLDGAACETTGGLQ
jgi:hypothetical protein